MWTNSASNAALETSYTELLNIAAALWGIEKEYHDIWGSIHKPSEQVKQAILSSLGVACSNSEELAGSIGQRLHREWSRSSPHTLVVPAGQTVPLTLRIPRPGAARTLSWELQEENGETRRGALDLSGFETTARAETPDGFLEISFALPTPVPHGYHLLRTRIGTDSEVETRLIAVPRRAWLPERLANGGRAAGLSISLYGIRSDRNWGCGDFTDLNSLVEWVRHDLHAGFVALSPLHAIENRTPYNISPYLPNSTLFRNPLYLDIESVEEFRQSPAAGKLFRSAPVRQRLVALRLAEFVDYEAVWRLKRFFLKLLFREFLLRASPGRRQSLESFCQAGGERLERFALYSALWDWLHKRDPNLWIWPQWPAEYQNPESSAVGLFAQRNQRRILFYKYVQWLIDQQLEDVQQRCRDLGLEIGLYHDLALATDSCGADLWAYRPFFVSGCRVGSPPDGFAPNGQDWAFPPPNRDRHREDGYRLFIDMIRASSRHGGALRIDHVMRLFRLYWIPDGMEAAHGLYVQDYYEDLLGILALESVRNRFLIVGEDLGTVSDLVREQLERFGILSYRVFYFEKHDGGHFRKSDQYPGQALVSSTTHDLPTLAGFWTGRDIEARQQAGLLPDDASYRRQIDERAADKQSILDLLHEQTLLPEWFPRRTDEVPALEGELHNAVIGFLAQTPSMLFALNQEDLTKETEQQNLPASTVEYPNWRRKMKYSLEQLRTLDAARDFSAMFRNWLHETGRAES